MTPEFKLIKTNRIIVHKIIGKKGSDPAYAIHSKVIHHLDNETLTTLLSRIYNAVGKSKRFFETKIAKFENGSFWSLAKNLSKENKENFIAATCAIADLAVEAHQNKNRPGGLLIIIDGEVDNQDAVIAIKAELQEALTLNGDYVELIKELFLSPAKEFYKIGFLIRRSKGSNVTDFYSYVYDDNFQPKKSDLATYFYNDFLGLSTSENDKLYTNNFLRTFLDFVDNNIKDPTSRKHIKIALKADYRESSKPIIDPTEYIHYLDFNDDLISKYETSVLSRFPRSFSKDLTLVDNALKNSSLAVTNSIKLVGPSDQIDHAEIINPDDIKDRTRLTTEIDSGDVKKIVILKTGAILPSFNR